MALPVITTVSITNPSLGGFEVNCNLVSLGGDSVSSRGFVWGITPAPTLDNWWLDQGAKTSTGTFMCDYHGDTLEPDVTYHIRAFATNEEGTAYGNELTFEVVATLPVVSTGLLSKVVVGNYVVGGAVTDATPGFEFVINIRSTGEKRVTACGIVWANHTAPNANDNIKNCGTRESPGTKKARAPGTIVDGEIYYVRAYATNSLGTVYGEEVSFGAEANFKWEFVATPDHSRLEGLENDDHPQYLTEARHDLIARHPLGTVVPHDDHGQLFGLGDDDHPQYLTTGRHALESHARLIRYTEPVTNGDAASPELVYDTDGDLIYGEV